MKIYRAALSYEDGVCLLWAPSKRAAQSGAAAMAIESEMTVMSIKAVDVPTTKADLIAWLNANLGTDNG